MKITAEKLKLKKSLNNLPILSIETSQTVCGACVLLDENKFFETMINFKNSHAESIFNVIDSVLKLSGISLFELGSIAVSSGPGSFTGLRIGMSAAKGIAVGASLPIIPVPTFEALALQLSHQLPEGSYFTIANKVNAEESFYGKFQVKNNSYIFVQELQVVKIASKFLESEDCLIFGNALPAAETKKNKTLDVIYPTPEYVAKWGLLFGNKHVLENFDYLEPEYLKEFILRNK